ncbi:IclR family transcriptional regulator [Paenibacillus sp. GCM10012307]|uniref:Glycerol operon regulatory protein n=1 Tax=Paenibacillus roseus TaxID=2798579 RepID=A0A934MQ58_9BACL|nr:IclR family transcriptional regulator [Paenibacillus roseus]MBJ6362801.1 IclR family transcriptional regulator [Paenibacillus roseus]
MEEHKSTVRAVERALDILLCFTDGTDLAMTEIAERVGLHKSTVHRMLATLEERGFIARDSASDRYRLGMRIWELSTHLSNNDDPAIILLPEMERLRDELGETVSLYIRDGDDRLRVQAVQSGQAIRRVAPVGARLPLYVGASSKVLIAFAEEADREVLMNGKSWPTGFDRKQLEEQLEEIRRIGYATSVEEREAGAAAVATPIFHRSGKLAAALSVSGPASRLTLKKMRDYAPIIMNSARLMGTMVK